MFRSFRPLAILAILFAVSLAGCNGPGSETSNPVDDGDSPTLDSKGIGQDQAAPRSSR